ETVGMTDKSSPGIRVRSPLADRANGQAEASESRLGKVERKLRCDAFGTNMEVTVPEEALRRRVVEGVPISLGGELVAERRELGDRHVFDLPWTWVRRNREPGGWLQAAEVAAERQGRLRRSLPKGAAVRRFKVEDQAAGAGAQHLCRHRRFPLGLSPFRYCP